MQADRFQNALAYFATAVNYARKKFMKWAPRLGCFYGSPRTPVLSPVLPDGPERTGHRWSCPSTPETSITKVVKHLVKATIQRVAFDKRGDDENDKL
jgi:hypothetical protein